MRNVAKQIRAARAEGVWAGTRVHRAVGRSRRIANEAETTQTRQSMHMSHRSTKAARYARREVVTTCASRSQERLTHGDQRAFVMTVAVARDEPVAVRE